MELNSTYNIVCENSVNENSDIAYQPELVGKLIKEVLSRSMVADICNFRPLTQPTGYVFGVKPNSSDKIEIVKNFVEAKDHIKLTTITKEVVDDIFSQYGESGTELLTSLLKRDVALDQDKDVVNFMRTISTKVDDVTVTADNIEAGQRYVETLVDTFIIKMATNLKTNMSGFIVASPKVAALLLRAFSANFAEQRNKMIGYVGSLGERDLYVDYWTEDDYILIGLNSKEELKGVFFSPYDMSVTYSTEAQSGANIVRVNNRYAITRNPLDNDGVNDSIFFTSFPITFQLDGLDFDEFLKAFNNQLTDEIDTGINP
jgi:hypothetical protein